MNPLTTALEINGILTCTPEGTGKPLGKYVFQRTKPGLGNTPGDKTKTRQIRRWVQGANPRTPAQMRQRARFAEGVAEWHTLAPEQRAAWKKIGRPRSLNGFQAFMRNWCLTTILPAHTVWDGAATIWDDGLTDWD